MIEQDLYITLGIVRSSSEGEIRRAFRKLARKYHPDINPGDQSAEERFKRIATAYQVLGDPKKREFYDENGYFEESALGAESERSWGFFQGFDFSHVGDIGFDELFGSRPRRRRTAGEPERGADLEYQVALSFEESVRGVRIRITVFRKHECDRCGGTGQSAGSKTSPCRSCGGTGQLSKSKGHLRFSLACMDCGGTGRHFPACGFCGREGRISGSELLDVAIPPGVNPGFRFRVAGKGDAGRFWGPTGDLFIVTNVAPHPFFRRMGDNVYCTIPITVAEAALGYKLEVPTIDGKALVRIPPGTQNGQTFRLRGKGMPSLRSAGVRGDQYVEVRIVIPRIADERSKEILRELGRLNPDNPRHGLYGHGG